MARRDFVRQGHPRQGQWAWLDNSILGIVQGPDHGHYRIQETLCGNPPKVELEVTAFPHPGRLIVPKDVRADFYRFDVVDPKDGFACQIHLLVHIDRLKPVTRLQDIPKRRRDTCQPGWTPRA